MGKPELVLGLKVLEREPPWDDGTLVVWLASPFPYGPKPALPSWMHRSAQKRRVRLDGLHGTQRRVTEAGVRRYMRDGWPGNLPLVYKQSGELFIADGTHRLTAAALRGRATADVMLVDADALEGHG